MKKNLSINEQQVFAPLGGKAGFKDLATGKWTQLDIKGSNPASVQAKLNQYAALRGREQLLKDAEQLSQKPTATAPAPKPPAATTPAPTPRGQAPAPRPQVSQTGDKAKDRESWEKANPRLAEVERLRKQQRDAGKSVFDKEFRQNVVNPVMYGKKTVEDSKKTNPDKSTPVTTKEEKMDSFDFVLEYLLSEGHTDTLEEALYVMMEMDPETIQSIYEGYQELNYKRRNRMTDQAMRHMSKGDDKSWKKAYSIENQRDTQTPEVSKAKAAANRARGAAKRGKG